MSRSKATWLDILAILHALGAVYLLVCQVGDKNVGLIYFWFAVVAAIIAWGLWLRRPWVRESVILVYGIASGFPPFPAVQILLEMDARGLGMGAEFVLVFLFLFWVHAVLASAVMVWSVYGRRYRELFGEASGLRFDRKTVVICAVNLGLMLGGIMDLMGFF